jgi:hypothetical protein
VTLIAAAKAAAVDWDAAAFLAMPSAMAVGMVNLSSAYSKEVGWSSLRHIAGSHKRQVIGLALLDGLAGVAITLIVVLLGVTKPGWLDEPGGWFLLGTVGPAVAAISISKLTFGTTELNLGLSLIYSPIRQMLLEPLDDEVYETGTPVQQEREVQYRRLALEAFDGGELSLSDAMAALEKYGQRSARSAEDRAAITTQLTYMRASGATTGGDAARDREQLQTLVAFMVDKRYFAVLRSLLGKPSEEDRDAISAPEPPPDAVS